MLNMLIISRHARQGIKLIFPRDGNFIMTTDIEIKLLGFRWGQATIGISAPKEILILREELLDLDINEKEMAGIE